jgi:hypothetical protein
MEPKDTHDGEASPQPGRFPGLRELVSGVEENPAWRPGRYLETPQRWGVLPTLAFWNRRQVWRSAGLLLVPFILLGFQLSAKAADYLAWWLAPFTAVLSFLPILLGQGLLERYIRSRARTASQDTRHQAPPPSSKPSDSFLKNPRMAMSFLVLLGLALVAAMQWRLHRITQADAAAARTTSGPAQ